MRTVDSAANGPDQPNVPSFRLAGRDLDGFPSELDVRFAFSGPIGEWLIDRLTRDLREASLSKFFRFYYRIRKWIPISLRQRLQQRRNQSFSVEPDWYVPKELIEALQATIAAAPESQVIDPWPDDFVMAASMTHDVETAAGMRLIEPLAEIEQSLGIRSSWNLVARKYRIDEGLVRSLVENGHEIGIQGFNHDGRLYESSQTFSERAIAINEAIERYDSVGFRSPMVHRNLHWLQQLEIEYDSSTFDIDPFQAMPGGVGGLWPFIAGRFVELPYTLPQDHTLLVSLGETTPRIWIEKLKLLRRYRAMAMLITHPDYLDTPQRRDVYRRFLEHLVEQPKCWMALPRDIARWWRLRDRLRLTVANNQTVIVGSEAERAKVLRLQDLA